MRKLVTSGLITSGLITLGLITSAFTPSAFTPSAFTPSAFTPSTEVSESKSVVSNDPSVPGKCRPHSPCPGIPRLPGPTA